MKVLLSWLREFVPIAMTPEALAQALSLSGSAVERLEPVPPGIGGGDGADWVIDLDLTSNRPDCLSHYGIAREIAAITSQPLRPLPEAELAARSCGPTASLPVAIEAPEACGRYCVLEIGAAEVRPSPGELAYRLTALGQRPIHNFVDLTNATLLELGQPTHAFDADRLRGGELRVRWARPGETLTTLDGVERKLGGEDLVIADRDRPVALAGVMGGEETAVHPDTRRIWIESAWFDPLTIRRMARRHGMHTDASHLFERGGDPLAAPLAAWRIARQAAAWGARPAAALVDVAGGPLPAPAPLALRPGRVRRILGTAIEAAECERILNALGCRRTGGDETAFVWRVPSWRHDLTREIDLIEEVARLHGYDRFPARLPAFRGSAQPLAETPLRERLRHLLRGHGFSEAVSISFASEAECRAFAPAVQPVRVLNPLSEEAAVLQTSSLPAMLRLLQNNLARGVDAPKLFEIGKRYGLDPNGQPREEAALCLGAVIPGAAEDAFPVWKGEIEALLDGFALPPGGYSAAGVEYLHPGRAAVRPPFATFGQLHPSIAAAWKLPPEVWVAELRLDLLYALGPRRPHYRPPSRYPASDRDFSFLFADSVTWAQVDEALRPGDGAHAIPYLDTLEPVEVYRGPKLGEGRYSVLIRVRFQSEERTLAEDEIQSSANEVVRRLCRLGGVQR